MGLSHLFFLGLAGKEERKLAISGYIHQIKEVRSALFSIRESFNKILHNDPDSAHNRKDIFRFQGYTLDYGISAAEFELNWYKNF